MDACLEHAALELSEGPTHLQHELACWRRGVDALLIEVQINTAGLQALDRMQQIHEAAAQPVDRPSHHHVEPSPLRPLQHLVEPRPILSLLGLADPSIVERLDDLPASRLRPPC